MGTNTHRLQCVSMEGGSTHGGGPRVGSWSSELPCALSGACDGNSGCEWPQPAGLQSSACCLMLGLTSSDFRAGCILSDGLNGRMAGGRERSLSEMWSLLGCLSWGQGRHHGVPGEQHPQHPALSSGTTGDPQSGCLGALVLASRATSLFLGRLSSAPLQSRGSAQRSEELFAVKRVPNISERIKKEAIKAPSSWLPACWLTGAPAAAGGELRSAAKACWGHGAPRDPL